MPPVTLDDVRVASDGTRWAVVGWAEVTWPQVSPLIGPQPHHRRLGQDRGVRTVAHQGQGVQGVLSSGPSWWWSGHNHLIYTRWILNIFQPKLLISVKWRKILKSQKHLGQGKWEVWEKILKKNRSDKTIKPENHKIPNCKLQLKIWLWKGFVIFCKKIWFL